VSAGRGGEGLAAYLVDLLGPVGSVGSSRFFGGYALRVGGVQFAMVIDGIAYLRADETLAAELESLGSSAFRYQTRRREVKVGAYWAIPDEALDDADQLVEWARRALRAARNASE